MNLKKINKEIKSNMKLFKDTTRVAFKPIDTTHKVNEIKAITELIKVYSQGFPISRSMRDDNEMIKVCEERIIELLKPIDNDSKRN